MISLMVGSVVDDADCQVDSDLGGYSSRSAANITQSPLSVTSETTGSSSVMGTISPTLSGSFSDENICKMGVAASVTLLAGIMQVLWRGLTLHTSTLEHMKLHEWIINKNN